MGIMLMSRCQGWKIKGRTVHNAHDVLSIQEISEDTIFETVMQQKHFFNTFHEYITKIINIYLMVTKILRSLPRDSYLIQ